MHKTIFLFSLFFTICAVCQFEMNRKNIHRPGSQSPPLPPPPPEDDENQNFGRPRTQSVGPLAPIVPDDQNLPGWVPKNYIEKGKLFTIHKHTSIKYIFKFHSSVNKSISKVY